MTSAYRLTKRQHQETAMDGEGARRYGGRWNSVGRPVVYAADSRALAVLETLVHLEDEAALRAGFVLLELTIPDECILYLETNLPDGWDAYPSNSISCEIGDQWIEAKSSLALAVPSVILPQEYNILINPVHQDFGKIVVEGPFTLNIDTRLK